MKVSDSKLLDDTYEVERLEGGVGERTCDNNHPLEKMTQS